MEEAYLATFQNYIIDLEFLNVAEFSRFNPNGNYPGMSVGQAAHADNADNAANAQNAENAQNAQNAVHAENADSATTATHADAADVAASANSVAWGNVANKPTTLLGYGITDAYTKEQSDNKYANIIIASASGNPATFTDGAGDFPVSNLIVNILATQSGSGDPSPTNIRPILVVSECNITANGDVKTIDLTSAGNLYGGTLNVSTGLLTITHTLFNMGSKSWSYNSGRAYFGRNFSGIKHSSTGAMPKMVCSGYKVVTTRSSEGWTSAPDFTIGQLYNADTVVVKDSRYTNATQFQNAVNGIYLVYELATPTTTYQLTPEQINIIYGSNTISADTGSVSFDYPADTKLYIDKNINAIMAIIANL